MAAKQLSDGSADGVSLGQSSTDKVSLFGATPVVQPSALTAPAATAATSSTPYGYSQAQADAVITWIRAADVLIKNLGITKAS